ncbi:UDP-2,4-diacetamido-2,4,6-trideoxy-beta-L-altropyranose hydrolase [Bizionia arctica]|uniref:UDP-2,4-diacetamido-2,4, 6-trideoxy-beta-L-altropyranose hydrolase n=1 Tax=Bizionia arctica TaxID=1495645 RepID=A0A917GBY9_9FLAO|nr:UDP-2,4-diacetamido-2,4,6-trideoxy-beta-L-altropyranose hydrolase [Bizionia arctica]GGG36587.1 UDP-2,4-diacetamido-2,4,6-trideoxy-beta-L-altropyranose hydrolase [Bizionia arctica]
MTKKVIFRADGSSTAGLGHLYRLFSLVETVKNTLEFVFITHETSTNSVIPEEYNTVIIPKEINTLDEADWLQANFSSKEYIIIADGYQFTSSYQKQIKSKGYSLIYIDDLAKEHIYADVVINHSPYIQEKHYKKEVYSKLALGTKFALLRPLFLKAAKKNRAVKELDSAFVCFGGADPFHLTLKAVQALLLFENFKSIHVVLGAAYLDEEIFNLEEKYGRKIKIYRNLSEKKLIETMEQCNFAIAPASTILYELCCVQMPIFSGFYVDNQELIYKGFLNHKAIFEGGNMENYQVSDFVNGLKIIFENKEFNSQLEAQKILFDDKITKRHLDLIKSLC